MKCRYRNCQNELGEAPTFKLCETCRILDNADRLRIVVDPTSPRRPNHAEGIIEVMITQMTGEEMLRYQSNIEFVYLELCKKVRLYSPAASTKRAKLTLEEQIEDARASSDAVSIRAKTAKRRETKKLSTLQKQMNALGCSEECRSTHKECVHMKEAKRIFESDYGEL